MFAAGSLVRGEGTEKSDIDLHIIFANEDLPKAYRDTVIYYDYICELFVQNENAFEYFLGQEPGDGTPVIMTMDIEGVPFGDREYAAEIKRRAKDMLAAGPLPLTEDQIMAKRYSITDLMDDIPAKNDGELLGTLSVLQQRLGDFFLRANNRWSGHRKSLHRALRNYDSDFAERYVRAFSAAFRENDMAPLEKLVDEVLAPFGGRLMAGYKSFAPDKANRPKE